MATRDYVIDLPVVVSVTDGDDQHLPFVQIEVDLAELASFIWDSSHEGEEYSDEVLEADAAALERWSDFNVVKNEGFAPTQSKEIGELHE